jgi:hypothetical protein
LWWATISLLWRTVVVTEPSVVFLVESRRSTRWGLILGVGGTLLVVVLLC